MRTPPLIRTKEEVKAKLNLLEVRLYYNYFSLIIIAVIMDNYYLVQCITFVGLR